MSNVHTFRPKRATVALSPPPSPAMIRAEIEATALAAMDAADRLITLLDALDGDETLEDGSDAEPSLGAPEQHHGSQVVWMRGCDDDREIRSSEEGQASAENSKARHDQYSAGGLKC